MARTPTLLDPHGRPVRRAELTKMQAEPGLTGVRQAFGPSVAPGLTPQRLAAILRACDDGNTHDYLVLAEEMEERDPHYASVLGVRKRAVSGVEPVVEPASEDPRDQKIAEDVRETIAMSDAFPDLIEDMLDALGKGFSAIEIDWKRGAQRWTPRAYIHRDQRYFRFDRATGRELRLIDEQDPAEGIPLEPFKWIEHRTRLKSGLPARGGLARLVAFGWMCKAYTLKDWVAFIETYGLPLRLGRYGGEHSAQDIEKLFSAVANIGTDAAAVLPRGMEIEFQETGSVNGDRIFESLARYVDEQTSKAVLGQTMTADNGSSRAQAEVHDNVRHDIASADARAVAGTLNRDLVKPYVDLNYGVPKRYPRITIPIAEPEDTDMIIRNVTRLAVAGVRFNQSEVRQRLGFSDPEPGDDVVGGPPEPRRPGAGTAMNRETPGPADALDELEAEMLEDWEEVMGETLDPIEAIIEGAGSYEEVMERLAGLDGLPSSRIIDTLVKGMFKARAQGDVTDE